MRTRFPLLALLALLLALPVQAQTTFDVTVIPSTDDNPRPDPWSVVYAMDGVESAELTLVRGETYVFQMNDVPSVHPFYISTSEVGAGAGVWNEGVTGNFATGSATLTFTVPETAPDLLYYECANHPRMGWRLNITDATDAEASAPAPTFALSTAYPNPVRDRTTLFLSLAEAQDVTVEAFDLSGRRVAVLYEGASAAGARQPVVFETEGLPAGTYFVRATVGEASVERRVTVVR
ncbi:MAG: T9SS type A sorting domain-containing protein [Rhodothermales bacterium]|nr:T9SS type A sorting domain-containing protein [Rhodothermales bacterium]